MKSKFDDLMRSLGWREVRRGAPESAADSDEERVFFDPQARQRIWLKYTPALTAVFERYLKNEIRSEDGRRESRRIIGIIGDESRQAEGGREDEETL